MEDIEKVINHFKYNIKTDLKCSPIHNIGVFAIKDIKEGEQLFPDWDGESGYYFIPRNRLIELPKQVGKVIYTYFIYEEPDFKEVKLYKGLNFLWHNYTFVNSAWPNPEKRNIKDGIALRDIAEGEEIFEWYTENISAAN